MKDKVGEKKIPNTTKEIPQLNSINGGSITLWIEKIVIIKKEYSYVNAGKGSPFGLDMFWDLDMLTTPCQSFEATQHSVF